MEPCKLSVFLIFVYRDPDEREMIYFDNGTDDILFREMIYFDNGTKIPDKTDDIYIYLGKGDDLF
jgi:hypothetical protein